MIEDANDYLVYTRMAYNVVEFALARGRGFGANEWGTRGAFDRTWSFSHEQGKENSSHDIFS